jgi:phosphoserine phosphatase RsbU/P
MVRSAAGSQASALRPGLNSDKQFSIILLMRQAQQSTIRDQLTDRRRRLENVIVETGPAGDLVRLLREVDSALHRLDGEVFGNCLVCHTPVDDELLASNPLAQYCLCDLSREQQIALQNDLELAAQVQLALLPRQDLRVNGWETHFRYIPAGPVSGDYCDVVPRNGDGLFFAVGDVSGKGVAASLSMARLNALFRTLLDTGAGLREIVERANRFLVESMVASHYATLVCGKADHTGLVEICNAGHCSPLLIRENEVIPFASKGFPVGIFETGPYEVDSFLMTPGDTLLLYTDGLIEARNLRDEEYGTERLRLLLRGLACSSPQILVNACLKDVESFLAGGLRSDDLTLLVLRKH